MHCATQYATQSSFDSAGIPAHAAAQSSAQSALASDNGATAASSPESTTRRTLEMTASSRVDAASLVPGAPAPDPTRRASVDGASDVGPTDAQRLDPPKAHAGPRSSTTLSLLHFEATLLRATLPILVLAAGTACDTNRGPGFFGAYFVLYEPTDVPLEVAGDDWAVPGVIESFAPDGAWVVSSPSDGRWLVASETGLPEALLPDGTIWVTPSGYVTWRGSGGASALRFTPHDDVDSTRDVALPEALATVTDAAVDARLDRWFVGGVGEQAGLGPVGRVFASDDQGATWTKVGDQLEPVQGEAASVIFVSAHGIVRVGVCPPSGIYEAGSPVCEDYRLVDGETHRGFAANLPHTMGWDEDGRMLAGCRVETHGRPAAGLAVVEPGDANTPCDAHPPVLSGFLPEGTEGASYGDPSGTFQDLDGHLWRQGYNVDGYYWFRTARPPGRVFDEQARVIGGFGCADYYRREPDGGSDGRGADLVLTNGGAERLTVHLVLNHRPQGTNPVVGPLATIEPGATATVSRGEDAWVIALTPDGRCRGYGQVKRLSGRTL